MSRYSYILPLFFFTVLPIAAQEEVTDSIKDVTLKETTVRAERRGLFKGFGFTTNTETISSAELLRAACCNLGESFVTNPSVDVNYSDAATGAKQIRLLGLAGTYVQMLTENIPNFRGIAAPFGLDEVPGTWMQSIQVSKGAASVKNGYEAMTGQINIEYKKPQQANPNWLMVNGYGDMDGRVEGNLDATFRLKKRTTEGAGMEIGSWGTTVLAHYDKQLKAHDRNDDGFVDMPKVERAILMNRWTYLGDKIISQWGAKAMKESRESGQLSCGNNARMSDTAPYLIDIDTKRMEIFGKNAYTFNKEHNSNIALILSGNIHDHNSTYGRNLYDATQYNFYASAMFETAFSQRHSLSLGLSLNHDRYDERQGLVFSTLNAMGFPVELRYDVSETVADRVTKETVPGAYAQYTFNLNDALVLMGGIRIDHSNLFGTFVTPRAHLKLSPSKNFALRVSVGKGSRATHILAENNNLLAGSRTLNWTADVMQEVSWNYGASLSTKWLAGEHMMSLDLEYYYTHFQKQAVIDFDADAHAINIYQLHDIAGSGDKKSFSHVIQAQLSYPVCTVLNITAAYRWNDVRSTYLIADSRTALMEKPLQSRWKGLFTASYADELNHWQMDATVAVNGKARLPLGWNYTQSEGYGYSEIARKTAIASYGISNNSNTNGARNGSLNDLGKQCSYSPVFPTLNAQITRNWRQWSVYVGGENLTNFRQRHPIVEASQPWSEDFDPTMTWGPINGAMVYVGFRYKIMR